jgi:KDO2-lipid IV(A) lauroyltransferase
MSRIVFGFMWLVHFLPLSVVAAIGNAVGTVFYWLIAERRHVTRTNLAMCFPDMPPRERERLARSHFRAFCRSFIERGILWWAPRERIFAPHFVGLDATMSRLSLDYPVAAMYSHQKDPRFDRLLYRGRTRFGARLLSRQAGIRQGFRAIKAGDRYYFLPDLDFGRKRAVFVPFFGVPAATVTGLSYIARWTGAAVVPCVTRMLPGGGGYVARLYPAWTDYPSGDDTADARRMLAFVEQHVPAMPEQYFWLHKRFKTRPEGEKRFY